MTGRLALVALCVAASAPLCAQFSGRVTGSVVDSSGAPVPGAVVSLSMPGSTKPMVSGKTAADGVYHLIGVRPSDYDLTVEADGFTKAAIAALPVDPAHETDVQTITLKLATLSQSVNVTAGSDSVQTANAEISEVVDIDQVEKLPLLDRDPLGLLQIEAGVQANGNSYTVINGMRTSYANMTLDGINIQDNYIRDNALDYTPNRLLLGQVRQMTLISSNQNAAAPGGSAQVAFETPSGTNAFHGEGYWYNRNNALASNDWFNNQAGVSIPQLNQNEIGGSIGGPIKKDKLFFYTNYEAVRTDQQNPTTDTILTAGARQGIFTYVTAAGAVRQANLLNMRGITIDPYMQAELNKVPAASDINNFDVGDSTPQLLRNTAGYRFNQRDNEVRDNVTERLDWNLSTKHVFTTTFAWNRDNVDVPDPTYDVVPTTSNPNHSDFLSMAWRWTPTGNLTNEVRGGFNLAPGYFLNSQQYQGGFLVTGMSFTDPVSEQLPQGRATNTYSLSDNAAWQHNRHYVQFGFHMQQIRVHAFNDAGIVPTYNLAMGTGQPALTQAQLPGISSADLADANQLLATLGGFIDSSSQTFNVTSRTSGFVPNVGNIRNFKLSEYDIYAQDNFKFLKRLNLTLGLRYDMPGVADEANSLELQPQVINNNPVQTLLSNATLVFAGSSVGNPWYHRDWLDFAPNVGLAWDILGNGRVAFRAGYAISYVNDQAIVAPETMVENYGLIGQSTAVGLSNSVSTGLPTITPPTYVYPVTIADNYATNPLNTTTMINPGLKTPYVQQYSAGFQESLWGTIFEERYVGNHQVDGYRAFDQNQINITSNGFLGDFQRAESNGFLALGRTGVFNPAYNPSIPGSQQLTVFPQLYAGGQLTNATVRNLIETGQAGQLAATYAEDQTNGSVQFFANPYTLGADLLTNYSNSEYNSLQITARHRLRYGLDVTANYSFSKVLSDAAGDVQSRIEQFLDVNNPKLERAPADFDLRNAFKTATTYEIPYRTSWPIRRVLGGWSLGVITTWQSGAPFSILSGYGTLNRSDASRSYYNTADVAFGGAALQNLVQFQMTGNGPLIVNPSAINPNNGTGVATNPGGAPFTGEVFYNPGAGTLGVLQRRSFYGPWTFDMDASVQKTMRITERQSLELRIEGINVLNHATFYVGDQNINTNTLGVISSLFFSPRVMQLALHYRF